MSRHDSPQKKKQREERKEGEAIHAKKFNFIDWMILEDKKKKKIVVK